MREFIRQTFPQQDRLTFIDAIIRVYFKFIGTHRKEIKLRTSSSFFQYWTDNAELCVAAGKIKEALGCLQEVKEAVYASDTPGAFIRACQLVFSDRTWKAHAEYPYFDTVFHTYFNMLVNLGREAEYLELIKRYEATVPAKDARYVHYCDLRCYMHWVRLEYEDAVKWGTIGKELTVSGVDTQWNTTHNLALAQRDSGQIDPALAVFLRDSPLEVIVDPDEFNEEKNGAFYGNIGRCLHLMGQIDPAIVCYRKSAIQLQSEGDQHVENQGFIRRWIGELLIVKEEYCLAKRFLEAAKYRWKLVCPPRVAYLDETLKGIEDKTCDCPTMSEQNTERFCLAWIYGRENNFVEI